MGIFRTLLVLVCFGLTLASTAIVTGAAQDAPAGKTVNVQIIVDASGSMAAPTNTGELRMDSARRVLTEVINAIPQAEGVNVGLRVYGHLGNNTDAGRPESCVSSDLLVPMQGVDKPALLAQVATLQPVGWTPIGYSLEQAAADFTEPASEDVVNAIIMVSDGLETCDADPAAIAGQLRSSEQGITTHVIGFGTTPEEQAILSGISESGGGQLLGSDNTGQLMSALFEILEELEVVEETGSGEARNSPLGVGRIGRVGDFEVSVLSVTPNVNHTIGAQALYLEPLAPNEQYFVATVSATYVGAAASNPGFELDYKAVGASASSYTTYNNTCGSLANDQYTVTEQFPGGSVEFTICWRIDSADADTLVMYIEPLLSVNAPPVWFSLGNPIEEPVAAEQGDADTPTPVPPTPLQAPQPTDAAGASAGGGVVTSSTRENPVPMGQTARVGDFEVTVTSATPYANDIIGSQAVYLEPLTPGYQYFLVTVSTTYVGAATGNPSFELDYQAVGASNSSYSAWQNSCGMLTNDIFNVTELFPGGTAEYSVCWQVESSDAASLVMYVEPTAQFDAPPVWFVIQP